MTMQTYITLLRFTQQGLEKIKDGPTRLEAAKQSIRAMGGEIKAFYLVMGQYDAVVVFEAPDDETVARFALANGARGFVRTETLRAFTEQQYRGIVGQLPG
jgi:uncharacterized protein with GYD domain